MFYWTGIVVMVTCLAARALWAAVPSGHRLISLIILGAELYLVKVFDSPNQFTFVDELQQLRSQIDVATAHHLFAANPLVPSYARYPGLEILTDAARNLTGLNTFASAILLMAVLRIVLVAALFLFLCEAINGHRLAALGVLIYMGNPNFVYFGAQAAYETVALPLAIVSLLLILRLTKANRRGLVCLTMIALIIGAVVVTHHMTTYWLVGFLALWSIAAAVGRTRDRWFIVSQSLVATTFAVSWFVFVAGRETIQELGPTLSAAFSSSISLLTHQSAKVPFRAGSAGAQSPLLERLLGFASVAFILVSLPFGVWTVLRRKRREPHWLALVVTASLYPLSLVLFLTQAGTETGERASEFLFVGLAAVIPLAWARSGLPAIEAWRRKSAFAGHHRRPSLRPSIRSPLWLAGVVLLTVGGILVGWPDFLRWPGPYLVAAAAGSVSTEGVVDANWGKRYLPGSASFVADGTNRLLFGSYGGLNPDGGLANGAPVSNLFFSQTFGSSDEEIIRYDKISFIVADMRLTQQVTATGYYFERDEPGAYAHTAPLPVKSLTKFNGVPGLDRVFDSGNIVIYDTTRILLRPGLDRG